MLPSPLAVIGIFMLGASAGSLVTYAKYRSAIGEFRRALGCLVVSDIPVTKAGAVVCHAVGPDAPNVSRRPNRIRRSAHPAASKNER